MVSRRGVILILAAASVARVLFLIWQCAGGPLAPRHGMSQRDFGSGYGIAAGYGYVTGGEEVLGALGDLGHEVEAGRIRVTPASAPPLPSADVRPEMLHPPGLPLLVAVLHRALGTDPSLAVAIIGLLLDVAAAGLVAQSAAMVFGPRVGLAAGLAYAVFPPLVYWSTVSRSADGLLGSFIVASLCASIHGMKSCGRKAWVWHALAGLALGLGSYMRPDYLLMPAAVGIGLWLASRRPAYAAGAAALTQAIALVVLLPWAARNHAHTGRWIFTSTAVGWTLVIGLGEFDNPWGFGPLDADRYREAALAGYPDPLTAEADLHFRRVFRDSVSERPLAYLKAVILRLPLALATPFTWGYENPYKTETFSQAHNARGEDRYAVVKRRPIYVFLAYWDRLAMAAVTGLASVAAAVVLWKERLWGGGSFLFFSPHIYSIGTHLITHMEPRYLLPSVFGWLTALAWVACALWRNRTPAAPGDGTHPPHLHTLKP